MATSAKDRMKAWRRRMKAAGYRELNLWLSRPAQERLETAVAERPALSKREAMTQVVETALAESKPAPASAVKPVPPPTAEADRVRRLEAELGHREAAMREDRKELNYWKQETLALRRRTAFTEEDVQLLRDASLVLEKRRAAHHRQWGHRLRALADRLEDTAAESPAFQAPSSSSETNPS